MCGPSQLPLFVFEAAWNGAQKIPKDESANEVDHRLTAWHMSRLPSLMQASEDAWDSFRLVEAVNSLRAFALVSTTVDNGYMRGSMHPLVHAWARDRQEERQQHESWIAMGCVVAASRSEREMWRVRRRHLQPHLQACTYYQGTATLQLYTHHLTAPKALGEPPEYHMTQIGGYQTTHDRETFVKGAGGLRNNRDRARTNRDDCIDHVNQIAGRAPADTSSTTLRSSRTSLSVLQEDEPDTLADEILTEQITAKRTRHTVIEKSRHPAIIPTAAPYSTTRLSHGSTISRRTMTNAQYVQSNARSWHPTEDGKSRRQIRPTQKVLDNSYVDGFRDRRR
ncbi:hypothetical protein LTR41_011958 [Exophiala xenobiotica]|nr:hypothetical protein LTR41_011958 [Exophiala xenobiotica]